MTPEQLLEQHELPKVMLGHAAALCERLAAGESIRHLALARLDISTSWRATDEARPRLTGALGALNELKGGLLAVTDRRLIYLGQTLVGRGKFKQGNELIEVPLGDVEGVRSKRGTGSGGDIRKVFTLILSGSKLWVTAAGVEQKFIEIKPLAAAAEMEATLRADS